MASPLPPKRRRWRTALLSCVGVAFLCLAGRASWHAYDQYLADQELAAAVAEANAVEPLRTLPEIEAARVEIPDSRNSALRILAAAKHFPPEEKEKTPAFVLKLIPPHALNANDAAQVSRELAANEAALAELRDLADLTEGRFRVDWQKNIAVTQLPHLFQLLRAARILQSQAVSQTQAEDLPAALQTTRAILNTGRSIGDEPCLLEALTRNSCRSRAIFTLEWILSQGTVPPADLAAMQELFEVESRHPVLTIAFTGERAAMQGVFTGMRDGSIAIDSDYPGASTSQALWGMWVRYASGPFLGRQQAWILRYHTRLVRISRQPEETWFPAIGQAEIQLGKAPIVAEAYIKAPDKVLGAACRSQAQLRCACAALAVERYRIANERWPDSLAELSPKFLSAVPLDPYNGEPLRLVRTADGVVIYSVGPDQTDNGGKLVRPYKAEPGTDLGFQLWDAPNRRAAPER